MFRRLALLALALCALAALEGCGGTSSLTGPDTAPARADGRPFGGGQREDDPGAPGGDRTPVYVDQPDTLWTGGVDER